MASLYESYENILTNIQKINGKIARKQGKLSALLSRQAEELPNRIASLEEQLKKVEAYRVKVEEFRKLAEGNLTSKNVLTIEAPPGYRINLNRLREWSKLIDPQTADDPYAQRLYQVALCDLFFLQQKKAEFEASRLELQTELERGHRDEIAALEHAIGGLRKKLREYVDSGEVREFAELVRAENDELVYKAAPKNYIQRREDPAYWTLGAAGYKLNADAECNKRLKDLLGDYYDEKKAVVYLPLQKISTDREFAIAISCVPASKRLHIMDAGVRALLLSMIDLGRTGERKIYIIDKMRQNSALAGSLRAIEGSDFLDELPRNSEMISSALEQIAASFLDIDDIMENEDTVLDYNRSVLEENSIRRSVVVMVGYPDAFKGDDWGMAQKILANYERYGISFVAVQITSEQNENKLSEEISKYAGASLIDIRMDRNDVMIREGKAKERPFLWYTFKHHLDPEYARFLRDFKMAGSGKGAEYAERVDLKNIPPYERGRKNISVPVGVDVMGEVHNFFFGDGNFASCLMGASASDRFMVLHSIITGIVRNYHPDDVELWLADFRGTEFARYRDPLPPHIKYLLLDKSEEALCDMIDGLSATLEERQTFFEQNPETATAEDVPAEVYMPVIFVVMDEFSVLSRLFARDENYRDKMRNLLENGRDAGIRFLFSCESFAACVNGLGDASRELIRGRIAMKSSRDEIESMLELDESEKTERVNAWMDVLPSQYVLLRCEERGQTPVKRLRAMYLESEGEKAPASQRDMIEAVNASLRKVALRSYGRKDNTYVEKSPVIADGTGDPTE